MSAAAAAMPDAQQQERSGPAPPVAPCCTYRGPLWSTPTRLVVTSTKNFMPFAIGRHVTEAVRQTVRGKLNDSLCGCLCRYVLCGPRDLWRVRLGRQRHSVVSAVGSSRRLREACPRRGIRKRTKGEQNHHDPPASDRIRPGEGASLMSAVAENRGRDRCGGGGRVR